MLLVVLIFTDQKRNGGLGIHYETGFSDTTLADSTKAALAREKA